ncbi:Cytochrome b561/ferric reductase transmembrane, partial [Arabidopsis thaliana x Arabidopsis arenosa]
IDAGAAYTPIPHELFTCKTLVVLKLQGVCLFKFDVSWCKRLVALKLEGLMDVISISSSSAVCLPFLHTLHVTHIWKLNNDSFCRLLSNCPLLSDLTLEEKTSDVMLDLNIVLPCLQRLSIITKFNSSTHLCSLLENYIRKLAIIAPFFKYFSIQEDMSLSILIPFYVRVRLGDPSKLEYTSVFDRIVHLEQSICDEVSQRTLVDLLQRFTKLVVLKLENVYRLTLNVYRWDTPSFVPECLLSSLEALEWRRYTGKDRDKGLMSYLLNHALRLKTVKIFSDVENKQQIVEDLASMPRGSKSCQIVFKATTDGVRARCDSKQFRNGKHFRSCIDLPVLDSYLHFSYVRETGVLDVAYRHTNVESSSWIAWGINPTSKGMVGAQTLLAYRNSSSGFMRAYTSSIKDYSTKLQEGPLSFHVTQLSAEFLNGEMTIFATIVLPTNTTVVNHLWQDGPLKEGDRLGMHAMNRDHLKSMASLDLLSGQVTTTKAANDIMLLVKNIHGLVNAVCWGIFMPIGVMAARYMRTYKGLDPTWFYIHIFFQTTGYFGGLLGGLGTAIYMAKHTGMRSTPHTVIGIFLFALGFLQILALKARPDKNHKYRKYWNWYHHTVGYVVIVLSVYNIYKGLAILQPGSSWKIAYSTIIGVIGLFAIVMEILQFNKRWGGLCCKKSKDLEADQTASIDV